MGKIIMSTNQVGLTFVNYRLCTWYECTSNSKRTYHLTDLRHQPLFVYNQRGSVIGKYYEVRVFMRKKFVRPFLDLILRR